MSSQGTYSVGAAKIVFRVAGCFDCGTEHSTGWSVAERVEIRIDGRRPIYVFVHRCADCVAKQAEWFKVSSTK